MKEWMTIYDLSEYVQISQGKVRDLMRQNKIPFYDKLGSPRFFKSEIDAWMKTPDDADLKPSNQSELCSITYRGKPISEYTLNVNAIRRFRDEDAWNKVPAFTKKTIIALNASGRSYIKSNALDPQAVNYNDYFKISFQLGLFDRRREEAETRYYPTESSRRISIQDSLENSKEVLLDSILQIVKDHKEATPHERPAVFLLWYVLKIRAAGLEPQEFYFRKEGESMGTSTIRLEFAMSLCNFLFNKDLAKESRFLNKWEKFKGRQFIGLATVRKEECLQSGTH
ncbi:MAG: helix-turn-helix domain-containing protein [Deltaproteobacteria bacterium]|nr:helix-turn-helix domain-containing protein [Deltaproteobacteria bacterium]